MNAQQALEAKRKEALEKFKTIKPRNPPIIGINCTRWPRMEQCYPSVMQALQAMRNMR